MRLSFADYTASVLIFRKENNDLESNSGSSSSTSSSSSSSSSYSEISSSSSSYSEVSTSNSSSSSYSEVSTSSSSSNSYSEVSSSSGETSKETYISYESSEGVTESNYDFSACSKETEEVKSESSEIKSEDGYTSKTAETNNYDFSDCGKETDEASSDNSKESSDNNQQSESKDTTDAYFGEYVNETDDTECEDSDKTNETELTSDDKNNEIIESDDEKNESNDDTVEQNSDETSNNLTQEEANNKQSEEVYENHDNDKNFFDNETNENKDEESESYDENLEKNEEERKITDETDENTSKHQNEETDRFAQKENQSLQESNEDTFEKENAKDNESDTQNKEPVTELKAKIEERNTTEAELKNKFDEVLSKEKGSDEYKQSLKEYNALHDKKAELDEQIENLEKQQALNAKVNNESELSQLNQEFEPANDFTDEEPIDINDNPVRVLKQDELDLLKSGNDAINKRLEAKEDDYKDKGLSEDEIRARLSADKWNYQKEFLEDAFPGQDVSPNVFNGFYENGTKDRIAETQNSSYLREVISNDSTAKSTPDINDKISYDDASVYESDYESLLNESNQNEIDTINDIKSTKICEELKGLVPENREFVVDEAFKDAPKEIVQELNNHISELKPTLDSGYGFNENGEYVKQGSYYSPNESRVYMDENVDNDEYKEVLPHELSHFLDQQRGWESRDPEFVKAIQSDLSRYDRSTPQGRMNFNQMLDEAVNTGAADDRAVSDLIFAVFGENGNDPEIYNHFIQEGIAPYSHNDNYWMGIDKNGIRAIDGGASMRQAEIYAEVGAVRCLNSKVPNHFLENYFPSIYTQYAKFYNIR